MTNKEKWAKAEETRKRRKNQVVKIYDLKLTGLSSGKRKILKRVFLEAKWFYNWIVADLGRRLNDPEATKATEVVVKVRENFEERGLLYLPAQVKQEIVKEIKLALKSLHTQKENERYVGALRFRSRRTTIPLKQPGNTFVFLNPQRTKVRIQKLGRFRVLGGRRIPEDAEVAKAYLQARADGYHLRLR